MNTIARVNRIEIGINTRAFEFRGLSSSFEPQKANPSGSDYKGNTVDAAEQS